MRRWELVRAPVDLVAHAAYMVGLHAQENDFGVLHDSGVVCAHRNHQLPGHCFGSLSISLSSADLVPTQEFLAEEGSGQNTAQLPQTDDRQLLNNSVFHA